MTALPRSLLDQLDAPLGARTVTWTCCGFLAGFLLLALASLGSSQAGVLPSGEPVGQDFSAFYTVSKLIAAGTPELAYDVQAAAKAFQQVVPGSTSEYLWQYAPPTHLLVWPLAALPFGYAAVAWTLLGVVGFVAAARLLARNRQATLVALASPALLWDIWHHQLGAFVATMLALGLFYSSTRPRLAGLAIGALIIKPHFAVLTPLLFVVTRAWQATLAAGLTVLALMACSWFAMGQETWSAFVRALPRSKLALEAHMFAERLMTSPFSAVRVAGGPLWAAYAAQAVVGLAATVACIATWRRTEDPHLRAAAGLAAAGLITPYIFVYDACLSALGIAALVGSRRPLPHGATGLLTISWFLPLPAHALSYLYGLQIGWAPSMIILFLALAAARPSALRH